MNRSVRTVIEHGPKGKKSVAIAIDWPGWSRGAKTAEAALDVLESYRERYRPVAEYAGLADEFAHAGALDVVEEYVGTGSTDFWGISFANSPLDQSPMPEDVLERRLALLQAAWRFFDEVAARVSPELRKGPRGGGRDRDAIINHTLGNEREQFAKQVGVITPPGVQLTPEGRRDHRERFVAAFRDYNAQGKMAGRKSTLSFLLRHTAYHLLDHAWEMEDRTLA